MNMTKIEQPFVSVVMPTYNHARFIGEAIKSVLNQTYPKFELIIIDNYSEDNTERIVSSYQDKRIRYFKFRNHGVIGASRNYGLKHAQGEYIAFLDSDDLWLDIKLETIVGYIEQPPAVDLICHDVWLETGSKRKVMKCGPHATYKDLLFKGNHIFTSATVVKREKLLEANGFSEDLRFNGVEDFELWLRLAKMGLSFYFLHEALGVYRSNGQGVTSNIIQHCQNILNVLNYHYDTWYTKTAYYRYLMQRHRSAQFHWVGNILRKQGNFHEAKQYLIMSLKVDPLNIKAWTITVMNLIRLQL